MLAAFSYSGFQITENKPSAYLLGIGIPAILILFWSKFLAPKAKRRLPFHWVLLVSLLLFESAAIALFLSGAPKWGATLAITALINIILRLFLKDKRHPS
jgi:hypothetical protein